MLTVKCYWAGYEVLRRQCKQALLEQTITEIKSELAYGRLTLVTLGTTFFITELCVDVHKGKKLFKLFQFKQCPSPP